MAERCSSKVQLLKPVGGSPGTNQGGSPSHQAPPAVAVVLSSERLSFRNWRRKYMKQWVICSQFLVGKLLAGTSFFSFPWKDRILFGSTNHRFFWGEQWAPLSSKLIIRASPRALRSPHKRPYGSGHPFQKGPRGPYSLTKQGEGSGELHQGHLTCSCHSHLIRSWKFWKAGIFAAAIHQCHLSEFRTIILLKCFRCHISNP